jgi:hypothetical protein
MPTLGSAFWVLSASFAEGCATLFEGYWPQDKPLTKNLIALHCLHRRGVQLNAPAMKINDPNAE